MSTSRNAATKRRHRRARKLRLRAWLIGYKEEQGCLQCGSRMELTFHHRDPATKVADISTLTARRASVQKVVAEVEKCDVLCLACHRALHENLSGAPEEKPFGH